MSLDHLQTRLRQDVQLRPEIIALLATHPQASAGELLSDVAQSADYSSSDRADACAALTAFLPDQLSTLQTLSRDDDDQVRREAERGLRPRVVTDASAPSPAQMLADTTPGDVAAGRRVFFRAVGARCSSCHTYDGRGGDVGPELTTIRRRGDRRWLLETILDPNRDVARRFTTTTVLMDDGRAFTGQLMPGPGDDDAEILAQVDGTRVTLPLDEIDARYYHTNSIMPEGLGQVLGRDELRDLIAFLLSSPGS